MLRIFIQEQSLFPHLFLSLYKYPSIFAFKFCSTVLYFLGYFCSESYVLLLLCKLYPFTNYNLHLWPPCKVFTDYVYIGYKPNTLVNILLHSNNLQIFWGISYFRQFCLQILVVLFLDSWAVNICFFFLCVYSNDENFG